MRTAVAYYRVSTEFQRQTGHSLESQRSAIRRHADEHGIRLIGEFEEAESGYRSSKLTLGKRPALQAALSTCKRQKATLLLAALDRLARNVVFIATLVESRVPFIALDLPGATPFMIHVYAAMAEEESRQKGRLISAGLALARARGTAGHYSCEMRAAAARSRAEHLRPVIESIIATGIIGALPICRELNGRGVPSELRRPWCRSTVDRMLKILSLDKCAPAPRNQQDAEARERSILPMVIRLREGGRNMSEVARELNLRGIRTGRGAEWTGERLWNFVRSRERRTRLLQSRAHQATRTV
jgi:DNA invertase Pin-like site-specific DNA recombinase